MPQKTVLTISGIALALVAAAGAVLFFFPRHSKPLLADTAINRGLPDMVPVDSGFFWMGSDSGEPDEKPVHQVWLGPFMIDVFPVTNEQYLAFAVETGNRKPRYIKDRACNAPRQAVVGVTWDEANAYCAWRSKKEGLVYRLPTEAEWEKAARGPDKRTYPWGDNEPTKRHAQTELQEKMPQVGACDLGKSPYGCYDMVGNVWQWCGDWYDAAYYAASPDSNPRGPAAESRKGRVVRGGNWVFLGCCSGSPAYALRCAQRNAFHPMLRKKSIGFRCVRVNASPAKEREMDASD